MIASDVALLDLLRKQDTMSVVEMVDIMEVTATAVRQRLTRLMEKGYIDRSVVKAGRGRPSHRYSLTSRGRRQTGANFADLAVALWQEIRAVRDPAVKRGLLQRITSRLVDQYTDQVQGDTIEEKMYSLRDLLEDKNIPASVDDRGNLPVLNVWACPYPELAEQDRSICAMERMMFAELLGESVRLEQCYFDEGNCCTFELN